MNTQQVSIWVPIAVGIIGVLGIIAGQLINAWREDRRWKREQEREELRWRRELHKDAETRTEANRAHWRDKKFETYTEILSFVKRWCDSIHIAAGLVDGGSKPVDPFASNFRKFRSEASERIDWIMLLASDDRTRDMAMQSLDTCGSFTHELLNGKLPKGDFDHISAVTEDVIDDMIAAIRIDLGIERKDDQAALLNSAKPAEGNT